MPEPHAKTRATAPPESPHAATLRRGFPRLKFEPALEEEFARAFRLETRAQVRRNLWLAIAFVVGFSWLTHLVLAAEVNRLLDVIRVATFGPILLVGLAVVHSSLYERMYAIAAQIGAPIFGAGVAVVAAIAAQYDVNLISTVVLVTIFIYFMLGMTFYSALSAALVVFAAYLLAAAVLSLPAASVLIDSGVLVFANFMGAMVCYSLERANRTNFLEERLLIETASRDGLTSIHNRRTFDEHVDRIWPQAVRERVPLALILVDIDHFKAYNDCYGHQAGDDVLKQVAWSLMHCARRPLDIAARYGGEEFAIVLYDARRDHVEDAARRIQMSIEDLAIEHLASPAPRKRLTVSVGAACIEPQSGRSHFGFIQLADEALYEAKERGRDRIVIMDKEYSELSTGSFRKGATGARSNAIPQPGQ
jgi:diguanylate cyclase (GGDEF)-like protein